jgi:hypothetical protein
MAPKGPKESSREAFERLRECFDTLKEKHTDPWCWHEYLQDEPEPEDDGETDPEILALRVKPRGYIDRLKVHLLACIGELSRAAAAADTAYFHMCITPNDMKPCCTILGSSGDIDEDMLADGDASPAKIMAALQRKLDDARDKMAEMEEEIRGLQETLQDTRFESEDRRLALEKMTMKQEETQTRLHLNTTALRNTLDSKAQLQLAYDDLHVRWVRSSKLLLYKGRELLRDKTFKANPRENIFYAFHGFIYILSHERDERKRREEEARRDAVEFALRNEVRFMMGENMRCREGAMRLTCEVGRLKIDRRELGCRMLYKMRPYEPLEYCLWIWEYWISLRPRLVLEKQLEQTGFQHAAALQQLVHTSSQLPPAAQTIDKLRREVAQACVEKDLARREITISTSVQMAALVEGLQGHRVQEMAVLKRLHELDVEGLKERIAVLEREIAEDKHIQALKGMVVDLEGRLRRALDRRKQRGLVIPPSSTAGQKCIQCGREELFRQWKVMPAFEEPTLTKSLSDSDLLPPLDELPAKFPGAVAPWALPQKAPLYSKPEAAENKKIDGSQPRDPKPAFSAVWRS